jgi:hypothetical protein
LEERNKAVLVVVIIEVVGGRGMHYDEEETMIRRILFLACKLLHVVYDTYAALQV